MLNKQRRGGLLYSKLKGIKLALLLETTKNENLK
jgi:hypothetical protein